MEGFDVDSNLVQLYNVAGSEAMKSTINQDRTGI